MRRLLLWVMVVGVVAGLSGGPRPVRSQTAPSITDNSLEFQLPSGVTFHLEARSPTTIEAASLRYGAEGRSCQANAAVQKLDVTPAAHLDVSWTWEFRRSGSVPPGASLWWEWVLRDQDGETTTPRRAAVVADDRYRWHTLTEAGLTVSWHQGSTAFGQALLAEALRQRDRLAREAGLELADPIQILVYADPAEIRSVVLYLPEWTGGLAYPEYNVILAGIAPGELAWARQVIPHELAHLVTGALVFNCVGVRVPTWLNEGLAMYAEGSADTSAQAALQADLEAGRLPPLRSLAQGFSADPAAADQAYQQSWAAVAFLIHEQGPAAMQALLSTLQSGQPIDEALHRVYGWDTDGLDAAWRQSQGGAAVTPRPTAQAATRTPVPTLALWTPIAAAPTTTLPPTDPPSPTPAPTQAPAAPTPSPAPTAEPAAAPGLWPAWTGWAALVSLIVLAAAFAAGWFWLYRRPL